MRIAIGSLTQRTIARAALEPRAVRRLTTMDGFTQNGLRRDAEMLDGSGPAQGAVAGFLRVLAEAGATVVPLLAADGGSGGPVMRETFHVLVTEMTHRLAARLPVDGVLLALDGAMAIEDEPDAAAEIVERVRNVLPPATPIGVTLGGCPRITERMRQPGVLLLEPREDVAETGQRTAQRLLDLVAGRRSAPGQAPAEGDPGNVPA